MKIQEYIDKLLESLSWRGEEPPVEDSKAFVVTSSDTLTLSPLYDPTTISANPYLAQIVQAVPETDDLVKEKRAVFQGMWGQSFRGWSPMFGSVLMTPEGKIKGAVVDKLGLSAIAGKMDADLSVTFLKKYSHALRGAANHELEYNLDPPREEDNLYVGQYRVILTGGPCYCYMTMSTDVPSPMQFFEFFNSLEA